MICKNCGVEITSEKIWYIHQKQCNVKQLEKADYSFLDFQELKSLAKEKGISTYKLKKVDIIEKLQELEG